MIFTTAQKSALLALIGQAPYAGQSSAQILALLNTPTSVPNPATRGTVPVRFNLAMLAGAIPQADRPALAAYLATATPLIIAQDAAHIADGLDGLVALGALSTADSAAMKAVLSATQPDPAWPTTVPGPSPFQSLFPGVKFVISPTESHVGTCTPAMLAEIQG